MTPTATDTGLFLTLLFLYLMLISAVLTTSAYKARHSLEKIALELERSRLNQEQWTHEQKPSSDSVAPPHSSRNY